MVSGDVCVWGGGGEKSMPWTSDTFHFITPQKNKKNNVEAS